jgi:hypothetical protein
MSTSFSVLGRRPRCPSSPLDDGRHVEGSRYVAECHPRISIALGSVVMREAGDGWNRRLHPVMLCQPRTKVVHLDIRRAEVADGEVPFADIGQDVELAFADTGQDRVAGMPEEEEVPLEVRHKEALADIRGLELPYSERPAHYDRIEEPRHDPCGIAMSRLCYQS